MRRTVLVLALPLAPIIQSLLLTLLPDAPPDTVLPRHTSVLDDAALNSPARSLASLRREVLRMADILAIMLEPVMELYRTYDSEGFRAGARILASGIGAQ